MDSYAQIFCLYSTYLDTLFCNLTFLQTFFSSLDVYLRLKNPTFYQASARRRPALWLKIGSPWVVAAMQSVGQIALSDRHQVRLHQTTALPTKGFQMTCLLPDPNFLIIRTVIAYALPLLACITLVALQLHSLHRIRHYTVESLEALIQMRVSKHSHTNQSCQTEKYIQRNSTAKYATCPRLRSVNQQNVHQFELVPLVATDYVEKSNTLTTIEGRAVLLEESVPGTQTRVTSFIISKTTPLSVDKLVEHIADPGERPTQENVDAPKPSTSSERIVYNHPLHSAAESTDSNYVVATSCSKVPERKNPNLSRSGSVNTDYNASHRLKRTENHYKLSQTSNDRISAVPNHTQYHKKYIPFEDHATSPTQDDADDLAACSSLWLTAYNGEQLAVAINLISCIIAVGTWSPYILATLAHGLCQPVSIPRSPHPLSPNAGMKTHPSRCFIQLTPDRVADFRWWAYASSGLLLPCLLFFLDLGLREGCWKALNYSPPNKSRQFTRLIDTIKSNESVSMYQCQTAPMHNRTSRNNLDSPVWATSHMDGQCVQIERRRDST